MNVGLTARLGCEPVLAAVGANAFRSPRIDLLDVAKGLGILLVVFGHNRWVADHYYALDRAISSFRLPFFFFIAGVTFPASRTVAEVALRRADAMLKPFAVTVLLLAIAQLAAGHPSIEFLGLELLYATGFTLAWEPLWFLPHLWLVSVLAATLLAVIGLRVRRRPIRVMLLSAMLVGGVYVLRLFHNPVQDGACLHISTFTAKLFECGLPFSADLVLVSGFYFLLGHFLATSIKTFRPKTRYFALSSLTFGSLLFAFNYTIILNLRLYDGIVVSTVQALAGIYLALTVCFGLCRLRNARRSLTYIGSGSLFVLIFHYWFQEKLFMLATNWFTPGLGISLLVLAAAVSLCLLVWEFVKRSRALSRLYLPVLARESATLVGSPVPRHQSPPA